MDEIIKEIWNWQKCGDVPKLQQNRKYSKFFQAHNKIDELELLRKHIDAIREAYKTKQRQMTGSYDETGLKENEDDIDSLLRKEMEKELAHGKEMFAKALYDDKRNAMSEPTEPTEPSTLNKDIFDNDNSSTSVVHTLETYTTTTTTLPLQGDGYNDKNKDNNIDFLRKVKVLRNELDLLITEYYSYNNHHDHPLSEASDDKNNIFADDLTVIKSLATQTKELNDEFVDVNCINIDADSYKSYASDFNCDIPVNEDEGCRLDFGKSNLDTETNDNSQKELVLMDCSEIDDKGDIPNIISFLKACNVHCNIDYDTNTCLIGTIDESMIYDSNKGQKEDVNVSGLKGYACSPNEDQKSTKSSISYTSSPTMNNNGEKLSLPKILITKSNGDNYCELPKDNIKQKVISKSPTHRKNSFYMGCDEVEEDSQTITNVPFDFICFLKNGNVCCDIDYTNKVCTLYTSDENEQSRKIESDIEDTDLHNTQKREQKLLLRTKNSFHTDLKNEDSYEYVIHDTCGAERMYTTHPPAFRDNDSDSDVSSSTTLSLMDGYDLV